MGHKTEKDVTYVSPLGADCREQDGNIFKELGDTYGL